MQTFALKYSCTRLHSCLCFVERDVLTIKELAKIAGLNHSTVSRSLNNSPLISDETKKRVLDLAAKYNFELNASARGMRTKKTGTIGVIFPVMRNRYRDMQYLGSLMNSLRNTIEENQYDSIITFPRNPKTGRSNIAKLLRQKKVDGMLLVVQDIDAEDWNLLNESEIPFISLHFKWNNPVQQKISYVYPDNYRGGYLAAEALIKSGAKSLVCLADEAGLIEFDDRTRGFTDAQREAGILPETNKIFRGRCGFEFGYDFVMRNKPILKKIDGIFAEADMIAIGAIEAMKELGVRVPEDLSVVGYDDIDIDLFFKPRLTTIHQPKEEYSEIACLKLVEMIETEDKSAIIQKVIEPELLIRESCIIRE